MHHLITATPRPLFCSAPTAPTAARILRAIGDRLPRRWPPIGITVTITTGTVLSLAPGLLPRSAATQAVLTALLVCVLLSSVSLIRRTVRGRDEDGPGPDPRNPRRRRRHDHESRGHPPHNSELRRTACRHPSRENRSHDRVPTGQDLYRWKPRLRRLGRFAPQARRGPVFAAAVVAILAATVHAEIWQNRLRDAMGVARTGPEYWPSWAAVAFLLTLALLAMRSWTGRALRRLGGSRALVMVVVAGLPMTLLGVPAAAGWSGPVPADSDLVRPVTLTRSGSAESLVSWSSLGREGQRFVTAGPSAAVQVYVGLRSAPDPAARAELAVRELDRAGGFDRSHLVLAVPTGSGWVDTRALRGFDSRFGGDVAVVALQYSHLPSWATFVFGRDAAAASARALVAAVERYTATLPDPPQLYLYGQSLGALGSSAVFAGAADQNRRVCSALWAGLPGGGAPEPGARTTVLANASDPVVHWSPALLWRPPNLSTVRRDAPTPDWLPVVSFVQTTADLLGALGTPSGHGHRYDVDQGTALPTCAQSR